MSWGQISSIDKVWNLAKYTNLSHGSSSVDAKVSIQRSRKLLVVTEGNRVLQQVTLRVPHPIVKSRDNSIFISTVIGNHDSKFRFRTRNINDYREICGVLSEFVPIEYLTAPTSSNNIAHIGSQGSDNIFSQNYSQGSPHDNLSQDIFGRSQSTSRNNSQMTGSQASRTSSVYSHANDVLDTDMGSVESHFDLNTLSRQQLKSMVQQLLKDPDFETLVHNVTEVLEDLPDCDLQENCFSDSSFDVDESMHGYSQPTASSTPIHSRNSSVVPPRFIPPVRTQNEFSQKPFDSVSVLNRYETQDYGR